jgi:hypothetical protein
VNQAVTSPVAAAQPQNVQGPVFGRVALKGRIRAVRRSRGQRTGFLTLLVMPAKDEYSSPATVEIFSPERLGDVDSDWKGWAEVGGYRRSYKTEQTDSHGEVRNVTVETADITLTAV